MLAKTHSETIICTPELARHLRTSCHFERQRAISSRNIDRLITERNHNRFVEGTQIFFAVLPDGQSYILNGNHTLEMVAKSGLSTELTFTYCNVRDIAEASRLYARFDIQKTRSWKVQLQAAGVDIDVPPDWQERSGAALAHLIRGFERYNDGSEGTIAGKSADNRLDLLIDYREAIENFHAATAGKRREAYVLLRRAAVLSVALEAFRYQPSTAEEFWGGIAHDDGLRSGDARKSLLEYLRAHSATNENANYQSRAAIQAWNYFFEGKPLQICKPSISKPPIVMGTPWDGTFDPVASYLNAPLPEPAKSSLREKSSVKTGKRLTKSGVEPATMIESANASE